MWRKDILCLLHPGSNTPKRKTLCSQVKKKVFPACYMEIKRRKISSHIKKRCSLLATPPPWLPCARIVKGRCAYCTVHTYVEYVDNAYINRQQTTQYSSGYGHPFTAICYRALCFLSILQ